MKHNNTVCSIAITLYPSYREGLTSPASNDFLETHLRECPNCKRSLKLFDNADTACTANLSEVSYLRRCRRLFFTATLGVFLGILLFALLFANLIFGVNYFFKLVTRQHTVHTYSPDDYRQWEDYQGISDFAIFPEDLSGCKTINQYQYRCDSSSILTALQLYLDCSYTQEDYETEKQRLLAVAKNDTGQALFAQPACYTMLFYDTSCEYAVFLEDEYRILYIFLENIPRDEIVFDETYLPLDYGNFGSPPENQAKPYCIYQNSSH